MALAVLVYVLGSAASAELPKGQLLIEADGGVEVFDQKSMAEAKDNVVVQYGDLVMGCDILQAWYDNQTAGGGPFGKINRLEAHGNVVLNTPNESAHGEAATYDMATELLTLTGNPPSLEIAGKNGGASTLVTAKKVFKYNKLKQHLWAKDVQLQQPSQQLSAGVMDLFFNHDTSAPKASNDALVGAATQIKYGVASEGVVVITPAQVVSAETAFYDGRTNTIYLIGDVRIAHKENAKERIQMRGTFAEVDRTTGRSRLLTHLPETLDIPRELQPLLPVISAAPRHRVQILILETEAPS